MNKVKIPIKDTTIAILGNSYKANIRDIQISPSIKVIKLLQQLGAKLQIYDPYYEGEGIKNLKICSSLEEAIEGTKAIAILTDHSIFKDIDFKTIKNKNGTLVLIDSRNMCDVKTLPKGTIYCGVGRKIRLI